MNVDFDMPDLKLRPISSESVECLEKREKRTRREATGYNGSVNRGRKREREIIYLLTRN